MLGAYTQWLDSNSVRKAAIEAKIMGGKVK